MKKLTDQKAWALIAEMGWGGRTEDYKHLAKTYYKKLGKKGMKLLRQFVGARVSDLYAAVKRYEDKGVALEVGSDDGFSDLTYHIVGLGKDEFDACIADPEKMEIRYKKGEYTESFAYAFHEPEPPRTAKQKQATFDKLVAEAERLQDAVFALDKQAGLLRMQVQSLNLLVGAVKNDRKQTV